MCVSEKFWKFFAELNTAKVKKKKTWNSSKKKREKNYVAEPEWALPRRNPTGGACIQETPRGHGR